MKHRACGGHRSAGVLLHVSSLPGPHGTGDFGPRARAFADWLAEAGFGWWQVLPLNPTDPFYGNSPYRSISSAALSPLFVSPSGLVGDRLLAPGDIARLPGLPAGAAAYPGAGRRKAGLLRPACDRAEALTRDPGHRLGAAFRRFRARERGWLEDFALFAALKQRFGGKAWTGWPPPLRDRDPAALAEAGRRLRFETRRHELVQFLLDRQWRFLRRYCRGLGIGIIGDLPVYPDLDSAEVWTARRYFKLDRDGRPRFAAGVPPDRFSSTGQLWGNPVYDWAALDRDGFGWWLERVGRATRLFDVVRLDHFRGLVAGWQVPARARTARPGHWVRSRSAGLLAALRQRFPGLPFIAEDLGHITPAVRRARRRARLPGMRVAVFGFEQDRSPHRPDRAPPDTVLYASTHDTSTVRGWFETEAGPGERRRLACWLGHRVTGRTVADEVVRGCLESPARLAVVPAQDLLGLGARARMNRPGTARGNWRWRLRPGRLTAGLAASRRRALEAAGRVSGRR